MADFLEETYKIIEILNGKNEEEVAKKFPKALSMGGTPGERFSIVVCLLKTYEISNPELFDLIKDPANRLYEIADSLDYDIRANLDILRELS